MGSVLHQAGGSTGQSESGNNWGRISKRISEKYKAERKVEGTTPLRLCAHGYHHPHADNLDYRHSCDGCWCDDARDKRDYGWEH